MNEKTKFSVILQYNLNYMASAVVGQHQIQHGLGFTAIPGGRTQQRR